VTHVTTLPCQLIIVLHAKFGCDQSISFNNMEILKTFGLKTPFTPKNGNFEGFDPLNG